MTAGEALDGEGLPASPDEYADIKIDTSNLPYDGPLSVPDPWWIRILKALRI